MKCLCGYEYEEEYEKGSIHPKIIKGSKDFVRVKGHFTVTKSYDYHPDEIREVSLYSCPECGTIKINHNWY